MPVGGPVGEGASGRRCRRCPCGALRPSRTAGRRCRPTSVSSGRSRCARGIFTATVPGTADVAIAWPAAVRGPPNDYDSGVPRLRAAAKSSRSGSPLVRTTVCVARLTRKVQPPGRARPVRSTRFTWKYSGWSGHGPCRDRQVAGLGGTSADQRHCLVGVSAQVSGCDAHRVGHLLGMKVRGESSSSGMLVVSRSARRAVEVATVGFEAEYVLALGDSHGRRRNCTGADRVSRLRQNVGLRIEGPGRRAFILERG